MSRLMLSLISNNLFLIYYFSFFSPLFPNLWSFTSQQCPKDINNQAFTLWAPMWRMSDLPPSWAAKHTGIQRGPGTLAKRKELEVTV